MHAKHARRRDFTNLRRAASAAAVAVGLVLGLTSVSTAAPVNPAGSGAVRQAIVSPDTVNTHSIIDGQVYQRDINQAVADYFRDVPNKGVFWASLNNGIVSEDKLAGDVKEKLNAPDKDSNGTGGIVFGKYNVPIVNIGGPFATNATKVGEFTLEPGTSLVNTSAFFARTIAGVEGTRPQLALRYGDGQNAGTIMGAEISETANRELSGSTTKVVTVEAETTVTVWAFGYNDNASAAGGGEITVSAEVSAVKLG